MCFRSFVQDVVCPHFRIVWHLIACACCRGLSERHTSRSQLALLSIVWPGSSRRSVQRLRKLNSGGLAACFPQDSKGRLKIQPDSASFEAVGGNVSHPKKSAGASTVGK